MITKFDIRNATYAKRFLEEWLDINEDSIINYIAESRTGTDANEFCDINKIEIESKSVEKIRYVASHVTTTIDNLEYHKNNGLMDLASLLSSDSPMSQYLLSFGLNFDIENKELQYNDTVYNIDYYRDDKSKFFDRDSLEGKIDSIAHKVCYDNQISAFFTMKGDKEYLSQIHLRPEFLINISKFCKKDLENAWIRKAKSYVIEFEEKFENFEWFSFYYDKEDYYEDLESKMIHRRWMVNKALNTIWNDYYYDSISDEFAYMKPDYIIPWSNVINCRGIE